MTAPAASAVPSPPAYWGIGLTLGASLLGLGLTIALGSSLAVGVVLLGGLAFAALTLRNSDWATWLAVFILYSNAAAVLVKFHGVPSAVGLLVPALIAWPLLIQVIHRRQPILIGSALPWLAGLLAVQLLGVCGSSQPEIAWESLVTFLQEAVCLYLLVTNAVRQESTLRGAIWAMLLAGVVMGAVPMYQQVTDTTKKNYGGFGQLGDPNLDLEQIEDDVQLRLSGPIGEQNRYAQIMAMLLPLGLFRWRAERSKCWKLLAAFCLLLALAGTILSFSRGVIVALGLTVIWAAYVRLLDRKKTALMILGMTGALFLIPSYRERLVSLVNIVELTSGGRHSSADAALKGRATEMGAAAYVFLDHPLVGVGPGMFKYHSQEYGEKIGLRALKPERQAHSLPFDVAAENGALGLCCVLAIFWVCGRNLLKLRAELLPRRPALANCCTSFWFMLTVYFTTGLFLHFAFIRYFWLMIALADCTTYISRRALAESSVPSGKAVS